MMIYSLVTIAVLLLILIRVWKGSDLGFWVITCLFATFGVLLAVLFCGWFYLLIQRLNS
jgi:uncharacterized membrane protein